MTNIHEYLIVAIDCADAKLHNINISVIWQCLGQLPPFRPLNLWRNQIAPFVCLRQSGERGMISTQLEAWKKIGPWHPGAVQMCRHWNAIQIGWKHNWHITERKQWGPKTLGGTLNLLFRLKLVTLRKKMRKWRKIVRCSVHLLHWSFVRSGSHLVLLLSDILEVTGPESCLTVKRGAERTFNPLIGVIQTTGIFGIPININQVGERQIWWTAVRGLQAESAWFVCAKLTSVSCHLACVEELMAKIEAKKTRSIQIHELKIVWFVLIFPIIPAVAQPHISKGLHKLTHCPFEKVQRTSVMWSGIGVSARSKQQFLNGLIPHGAGSWSRKTFKGFPLNLCLDGIWIGVWSQIEVGFNMFQSIPE